MLGNFTVKTQNCEEICIQLKTIICVTYVQNNFYIRTLIKQLFTFDEILMKLPQIFAKVIIFKA